jgi:hypothetical protein
MSVRLMLLKETERTCVRASPVICFANTVQFAGGSWINVVLVVGALRRSAASGRNLNCSVTAVMIQTDRQTDRHTWRWMSLQCVF